MAKDWTQDEVIKDLERVIEKQDKEIERLREAAKDRPKDRPNEAADEIERLREALKQIASTTKIITFENDQLLPALHLLVLNNLKIARAALKEGE